VSWFSRLLRSAQRNRLNRDLEDEQQFHIESRVNDLMRDGMTRDHAEQEACRHFGNRMLLREASRTPATVYSPNRETNYGTLEIRTAMALPPWRTS
jgi:hypothetical protein